MILPIYLYGQPVLRKETEEIENTPELKQLISDNKEYKKALDEMNEVFRQSLPYFEEAHRMNPEDRAYMQILKGLYYRFHMDAKYEEISEKLNNL